MRSKDETVSMWWLVPVLGAALAGCAAMHQQQVANLRANGEHAKAACYEACSPSDVACLQQCDNRHPPAVNPEVAAYARVASAAAAEAAKANAAPAPAAANPRQQTQTQRNLTINGTTYTGGDRLGQPCGIDRPCPDGYKCNLVTERSGQCVQ